MLLATDNSIVTRVSIDAPDVIEGISAIWADTDNDGVREIVVTVSNADVGATIVVYEDPAST